jgi:hypothetical protein
MRPALRFDQKGLSSIVHVIFHRVEFRFDAVAREMTHCVASESRLPLDFLVLDDRQDDDTLGALEIRKPLREGACGLAAAIPADDHTLQIETPLGIFGH